MIAHFLSDPEVHDWLRSILMIVAVIIVLRLVERQLLENVKRKR